MKILVARSAGFCWGVRRAVDSALEASARWGNQGPVQTLGPLIHNPQALAHLDRRGVGIVDSPAEAREGTVIIRAHGIPIQELRGLKEGHRRKTIRLVNGTCPEVARVQARIKRWSARGYFTVLLGTHGHAEALAHESYAVSGWAVVANLQEAEALDLDPVKRLLVVAQTTFLTSDFQVISSHLASRVPDCLVLNTICRDTLHRQEEAEALCHKADSLIVVGGKSSNNTRHLVSLAQAAGKPVQWVESAADLEASALTGSDLVGVLAGASTPTWTVDEVVEALEQAARPSRIRQWRRLSRTLQLPLTLGAGLLTYSLHHLLGWSTGWPGPALPVLVPIALCATLPFLDPQGLDTKGQVQAQFLAAHRHALLGLGALTGSLALLAAALEGPWALTGTLLLGLLAVTYLRAPALRRIPALKDLGQALSPALLAILFPSHPGQFNTGPGLAAFAACFSLALALHGLRHLRAFREDRILGPEILPVAIGSRATKGLAGALLLGAASLVGWILQVQGMTGLK